MPTTSLHRDHCCERPQWYHPCRWRGQGCLPCSSRAKFSVRHSRSRYPTRRSLLSVSGGRTCMSVVTLLSERPNTCYHSRRQKVQTHSCLVQGVVLELVQFIYSEDVAIIFNAHNVQYHIFADDKHLFASAPVAEDTKSRIRWSSALLPSRTGVRPVDCSWTTARQKQWRRQAWGTCHCPPLQFDARTNFSLFFGQENIVFFLLPEAFCGLKYAENAIAAGAPTRTPLGELTTLPHTP